MPVTDSVLLTEPWMRKTSMLVIPGGADLSYCKVLNGKGNKRIVDFVKGGGKFIGFCAGAYYASSRCEFDIGGPLEVSGSRELHFYPGISRGCAFKGFAYESQSGARAANLSVDTKLLPGLPQNVINYYNGGGIFVEASKYKDVEILARYDDATDIEDNKDKAAIIYRKLGKGDVLLAQTHPEYSPKLFKTVDAKFKPVVTKLLEGDYTRKLLVRDLLKKVGLRVRESVDEEVPSVTPMYIASSQPSRVNDMLSKLMNNLKIENGFFEDRNDVFTFQDISSTKHDYKHPDFNEEDNPTKTIKHLNFVTGEEFPSIKTTPYFNMQKYFDALKALRKGAGLESGSGSGSGCELGGILGYSEVITSTNTIMDKNPQLLEQLPHGFTLTASTQIAGRGRGGNVWVNPRGVLATSVLFRIPPSPVASSSIVTLQYLCGLALIEAILGYGSISSSRGVGYEDMPLRLKWPNDIYILKPEYFVTVEQEIGSMVDGNDEKYVKVSGALINSQFFNGQYNLVWGGGVNVSNPSPTTSLNLVLNRLNYIRKSKGLETLPPYEPELLLAKLLFIMDQFYKVFSKSGLKPFLPLYYRRWLHSGQKVDVEGTNGDRKTCIIKGITPDYGMLIAEDIQSHKVLHLQPDGNSFDIFKGLVYKKGT
ncbi:BPL1 [Candida oxycetoniae]|uniref:BPL1 n=1 Tax=Candida oxycetoniae TaxID=497107 RepID=A0AAI9T225_9ASCO|nr:BPL1 [Candida oxycetoniae]KAI3407007.2 BPL1 [Candida oxycetoniae]